MTENGKNVDMKKAAQILPTQVLATLDDVTELGRLLNRPMSLDKEGAPSFVLGKDGSGALMALSLEHLQPNPARKKAHAQLTDAFSFVAYINEHKNNASRIFASRKNLRLACIIDYHEPGNGKPQWGQHIAELQFTRSEEWQAWRRENCKLMPQCVFADFLRDNVQDITAPPAATLLEVARDLSARKTVGYQSAVEDKDGDIIFHYKEDTTARAGELEIPEEFALSLALFDGLDTFEIPCRLRYRIDATTHILSLGYVIPGLARIERDAIDGACAKIRKDSGMPVYFGTRVDCT